MSKQLAKEKNKIQFVSAFLPSQDDNDQVATALAKYIVAEHMLMAYSRDSTFQTPRGGVLKTVASEYFEGLSALVAAGQRIDEMAQAGGLSFE